MFTEDGARRHGAFNSEQTAHAPRYSRRTKRAPSAENLLEVGGRNAIISASNEGDAETAEEAKS